MEGDNRELTEEDREMIVNNSAVRERKDEVQWLSWYKEQVNKKKSEHRIVAVGRSRLYFFSVEEKKKKDAKLVHDAHLLELKELVSKATDMVQLVFRSFNVELTELPVDEAITAIRQAFETSFFAMPKQRRFTLTVSPESRLKPVEGPNQAALAKSCGSFSTTYQAFCDFYRVPLRVDICWDMDNLLPANHVREFDMKEFEQPLTPGDFKCLVETLHFNTHFVGFVAHDYKLDKDAMKMVADMLEVNEKIENLVLQNADGNAAGFELIGQAIAKNKKSAINRIDWSFNSVQDKGIAALGSALGALSHGLTLLNLDHGDGTKKGTVVLCNALKANAHMGRTLQTLNLAYNRLDAEGSNSLGAFLSTPNVIKDLNLSYTNANLEVLLPAMMRGSPELVNVNLSGNKVTPNAGAQLKTYLASASKLRDLNLSDSSIPVNIVREVFKAVIANKYLSSFSLSLAGNKLGVLGANMINGLAEEITSIEKLDVADNEFGDEGLGILAEGLCKCMCLKELNISDNFTKGKTKSRNQALDKIIDLLSIEESALEKLNMSATSAAFAIGVDLAPFIYALATNDSLAHLDISGHQMGDKGGIALGKALQTNRALQSLRWDGNNTQLTGFTGFKIGLERNSVLTSMPLPILDISQALKLQSGEVIKIQTVVNQISEAIGRNQSPKSKFSLEGYSQHISLGGVVEREELQKLKLRIRGHGQEPNAEQKKVLKDADENDTYIAELHAIQEEVRQALEDEVASKLGAFAGELVPFLGNTNRTLADRLVNSIKSRYQSFDGESLGKIRSELDRYTSVDKDNISRTLAIGAAQQITAEVTKSFVNSVEAASDAVFDQLLYKLEDVYYSMSGGPRPEEPSSSLGDSDSGKDEPGPASPAPVGAPKKAPPALPPKKTPPALPPKGAKPMPGLGGSAGGSGRGAPAPSPRATPPPAASGGGGEDAIPKAASNLTHMAKDRPLGPAQRRRPQRKPQRRPMMEGNE